MKTSIGAYSLVTVLFASTLFAQEYPTVTFHYSYIPFDRSCAKFTEFEIKEEWIEELYVKMDTLQGLWNHQGPTLLQNTVNIVGKSFLKKEVHATMTLCKFGSMSHPFLLSMRKYLSTATGDDPRPNYHFVGTVFHEILHIYVFDLLKDKENVPLLEKYGDEPNSVRNHLHLMALFKKAYLQAGMKKELEGMTERYVALDGIYGRAWEIVDHLEDHEDFIEELK
ncbi:hypothetical protein FVB32_05540 [Flagellimonas hymeniacidonis]|uniref:Uncharacterized protein n=1 Tax=Flagellimonas hymeniacidonis TaxID=2603628 RepID=A0A5C8V8S7_9FLAO|nr:hypothetical protein [Flagellimonas hymeniacidonis]TXN37753.1 hypothetical protein FVB32_05540 [Flagellimonas hymeniacidonis]